MKRLLYHFSICLFLYFFISSFVPPPVQAAVCSSCSQTNCCGDNCTSQCSPYGGSCSGSTIYGCGCDCNPAPTSGGFASPTSNPLGCTQSSQCSGLCAGNPNCSYTCHNGECFVTYDPGEPTPPGGTCTTFGPWSACSGGYQTSFCIAPASSNEYQIRQCVPDVTGPTSGPTSPPPVPTNTSVPIPTNTSVPIPTNTSVPIPTNTSVPVPTGQPTNTPVPIITNTPVPVITNTPVPIITNTPVPIPTPGGPPPVPNPSCGTYDPLTGTTPVTWSWSPSQASGLQVWDDVGTWWFNDWTNPPHTDSDIPTGRTVTARTTYDFTTFSATASITCTIPTPTPTKTPTPTPTPGPWVKLKNSSFMSSNNLIMPIPVSPISYDADDDGSAYFIVGAGGLVAAPSVNLTILNPNAKSSSNDWSAAYLMTTNVQTPENFLAYIKARKSYQTISSLDQISSDGIYYYDGATLDLNSVPASLNQYNAVLITAGTINIDRASFAPSKSIAYIAPTINFSASTTYVKGIFIATTITTGTTANQGLKIEGNLVAQTTFTNDREWADLRQPAIFIINDYQQYLDLLPYLSIANYEWRQIQ